MSERVRPGACRRGEVRNRRAMNVQARGVAEGARSRRGEEQEGRGAERTRSRKGEEQGQDQEGGEQAGEEQAGRGRVARTIDQLSWHQRSHKHRRCFINRASSFRCSR